MSKEKKVEENELLQELYQATQMGLNATQLVMPKIKDEGLRGVIRAQGNSYKKISAKSAQLLARNHETPKPEGMMKKVGMWGSIQMNTLADSSTEHLAEMVINGSNMGIVDMTKKLNDLECSDCGAKNLAQEYIQNEQQHIETLKEYL